VAAAPAAQPAPATPPTAAAPKAVAAAAAVQSTQPAQLPADRSNKVMLSLAASPPNAQLRVDGGIVENPFRMRLARDSKHRVEARAPGFTPEVHNLRMDGDVQLMISLKRDPMREMNIKPDPYKDARHSAANGPGPSRQRGAGFVSENPY
jgi:hypothetical protein